MCEPGPFGALAPTRQFFHFAGICKALRPFWTDFSVNLPYETFWGSGVKPIWHPKFVQPLLPYHWESRLYQFRRENTKATLAWEARRSAFQKFNYFQGEPSWPPAKFFRRCTRYPLGLSHTMKKFPFPLRKAAANGKKSLEVWLAFQSLTNKQTNKTTLQNPHRQNG
jgi:hypothetical protein